MISPLSFARLHERGRALGAWIDAGQDELWLLVLDKNVRIGRRTDWPGRQPGPEVRWRRAASDDRKGRDDGR